MSIVGRAITFTKNSGAGPDVIVGIRTKTLSYGAETIDITTDDDDGWRRILETAVAQRQFDFAFEGLVNNDEVLEIAASAEGLLVGNYTLTMPGIGTITGKFVFAGWEKTGAYNDATTFSITAQSTEECTVTPVST
jgi:predicted secreted protein